MDKRVDENLKEYKKALLGKSAEEIIRWVYENFSSQDVALASSLGAEDQVLTDILIKENPEGNIFTLDTGRLHQETLDVLQAVWEKYGKRIEILFPEREEVEKLVNEKGPNSFYESIDNRKECCRIRKIDPLKRKLGGLKLWITGLRKEQSVTRVELETIQWDETFQLLKVSPLAEWSEEDVWNYLKEKDVPYNKLHDRGFPSIGCEPCTRGIKEGEDVRAGRWWWEEPEHKECGLHIVDGKVVRRK